MTPLITIKIEILQITRILVRILVNIQNSNVIDSVKCVIYSSLISNNNDKLINSSNISDDFDIIFSNESHNNKINNSSLNSNISVINNDNNPVDNVMLKV